VFDALQRPSHLFVQSGTASEQLVERIVYGESHPDAENRNLRGVMHESYDGAGVAITVRRDFDGNPLEASRRLAADYHAAPDWTPLAALTSLADIEAAAASLLDTETFTTTAAFDALGRVVSRTTPDGSQTVPTYNQASFLERLDVHIRGAGTATTFVQNIDYNARGQRERIEHGNGTICEYEYDAQTFRLVRQHTTRTSDGRQLQDLRYEYDPVGNIVQVSDAVSFGNPDVSANGLYTYDPIYQLVTAEGREHPGQQPGADDAELLVLDHPNDLQTLRRYLETYVYDAVGNLAQVSHQPLGAGPPGWTRAYRYATDSNRLLGTSLPGDAVGRFSAVYSHDAAGNMITMPHLAQLGWDHAQRLVFADRGGGGQVYFAYDAGGQRVRKAYEHGGFVEERIYLGDYEIYRNRNRSTGAVAMERQTLHVDDAARLAALVETKTIDTSIPGFTPTTRQRYQLANHLDSTAAELDDSGAVISYEEYFPYGGTSWQASSSTTDVSRRRYRYTGQERDDETGLYYHGARYYVPWLGRWTSADPAGFLDGTNLYRYSRNNPILLKDSSGTSPGVNAHLISADDLPAPANGAEAAARAKVDLPTAENQGPQVVVDDVDRKQSLSTTWAQVRSSPGYVDNNIVSVGAPDADSWTLSINHLQYLYKDGSALTISARSVDLQSARIATNYRRVGGVIYPLGPDGNTVYDAANTPVIAQGLAVKLDDALAESEIRLQLAEATYAFASNIAALGSTLSMGNHGAVVGSEYIRGSSRGRGGGETQATTWREHETNVVARLRDENPGVNVGEQVTLKVTNTATNETVRIRADAIYPNQAGQYQIVDAKFSSVKNLTTANLESTVTPNQSAAYGWIKSGQPVRVVPVGGNARAAGLSVGRPIQIAPSVQVHVNGPGRIVVRSY
jgi:RHS repeat-associated protein